MPNSKLSIASANPDEDQVLWLNRNVAGMTLTSFFSDTGHEMVTAVLPGFLGTIGVAAGALGWIEGIADAASSFVKLGAGWYSDRIGHRKGIVTLGYLLTGTALALFAAAVSWPLILFGRLVSWFGRGIRGPLRDAMLAESVHPSLRGKVFGFHRAGDTAGAILGPAIGVALLGFLPAHTPAHPYRLIFLLSLIPGLASAVCFAATVKEVRRPADRAIKMWSAMKDLPRPYTRFLRGVALFGAGDFSHTLLILAAVLLLSPSLGATRAAQIAASLYIVRNVVYTLASFPAGALSDRIGKQTLLAIGYVLGALTALGAAALFLLPRAGIIPIGAVFALSGVYIAMEDTLEGAIPADLVKRENRGTAYGLMGAVNGMGDLVASALVGSLWTFVSPALAFALAALLMLSGAALTYWNRPSGHRGPQPL
jgi:MFS family permease